MPLASAIVLASALAAAPQALADPPFVDQRGDAHVLSELRGRTVIVMVVTARRLRNLRSWEQELRDRFPGLEFVRVADVPADPPVTREQVAEKLVERVPEEVSVWIDVERRWAETLELDTDLPNILVFDPDGRLVTRHRGRTSPELVDEVARSIDAVRGRP